MVVAPPIVELQEVHIVETVNAEETIEWTPERLEQLARNTAEAYDIDVEVFIETMRCESINFKDPAIQSGHYLHGKREQSFGVVQIHLPSHPDVSYEQAIDPVWALEWAANEFSKGNEHMWSCWRHLTR